MKKPLKRQTKHRLWAWICLSVNIAVASMVYACYTGPQKVLLFGLLLALVSVAQGVSLAWRDQGKKPSGVAVVIDYLGVLVLSLFGVYEVIEKTMLTVFWWFLPVFLLEIVGVYLIARKKRTTR